MNFLRNPYSVGRSGWGRACIRDAIGAPKGVGDRIDHRRGRADRACFACPLQSHRIGGRRHITGLESDRGEIVGARQATVQCSKELAAERGRHVFG